MRELLLAAATMNGNDGYLLGLLCGPFAIEGFHSSVGLVLELLPQLGGGPTVFKQTFFG